MKRVAAAVLAASLAVAASAAHAQAWKSVSDRPGKCHALVPSSWTPGEFGLGMQSPGGQSTIAISSSPIGLAEAKAVAGSTFTVQSVIEDSRSRYWVTIEDRVGKPLKHQYVAVPAHGYVCALTVDYDQNLSDEDARAIALSLKPR